MTEPAAAGATADATLAVPVWDLPVRLVHWSLVTLIAFSWWSAEYHHLEWHLWSGFGVLFLLSFRLMWGLIGSSTARFSSFVRGPRGVIGYLRKAHSWDRIGHTPLGALSVVALLGLIGAQLYFGLITTDEDGIVAGPLNRSVDFETGELARTIHHQLFNVLLGFIVLHVGAILFYRLVRGKDLIGAMVRGKGRAPGGAAQFVPASPARLVVALAFAAGVTAWVIMGAPPFHS
ncbi:cytochrome b/b6 domain-containing protein [Sphingomonas sp. KRR8]|uniref:cytochrome b/b6 domain-containing protein n=1 Tax=Sphingomonas sp. KRR8 TaxID=2942996 RepID=UPI002020D56A|nr:cytochrome b/b6 domain-containing protein [Sphingomonas sp. KRR8]URD61006.1 cytochrome b/b6 domain-containing protein [Sphingomonas sp. KRR8]